MLGPYDDPPADFDPYDDPWTACGGDRPDKLDPEEDD